MRKWIPSGRGHGIVFGFAVALGCMAGIAAAQQSVIGLYGDPGGTDCRVFDTQFEIVKIHMWVIGPEVVTGALFYAPTPDCWTDAMFMGDEFPAPYMNSGNSHDEVYGLQVFMRGDTQCIGGVAPPAYIGCMTFLVWGNGQTCCEYPLQPVAGHSFIEWHPCAPTAIEADFAPAIINPGETCACMGPVKTEETTWGRVKALYK